VCLSVLNLLLAALIDDVLAKFTASNLNAVVEWKSQKWMSGNGNWLEKKLRVRKIECLRGRQCGTDDGSIINV
jgi:hypothetical protein